MAVQKRAFKNTVQSLEALFTKSHKNPSSRDVSGTSGGGIFLSLSGVFLSNSSCALHKTKSVITLLLLTLLFMISLSFTSFAQSDESSGGIYYEESDTTRTERNDVSSSSSNEIKGNDGSSEELASESTEMSMMSGGSSPEATGGTYSSPEAVTVSQTGAASFRYPIAAPPGRNGLQPNVSLNYSSYSGNGWIGVGWDLDLGSIQRSTRNGLDYSSDDFMINGADLVL